MTNIGEVRRGRSPARARLASSSLALAGRQIRRRAAALKKTRPLDGFVDETVCRCDVRERQCQAQSAPWREDDQHLCQDTDHLMTNQMLIHSERRRPLLNLAMVHLCAQHPFERQSAR